MVIPWVVFFFLPDNLSHLGVFTDGLVIFFLKYIFFYNFFVILLDSD